MELVQYEPGHLRCLSLQDNQRMLTPVLADPKYAASLAEAGPAFTGIEAGKVVGCAGLVHQWSGRAIAWALLDRNCAYAMLGVHRATQRFLTECGVRRVEAYVDPNFRAAKKWALMLGFEYEGLMNCFTPDGRPSILFARIRGD